MSLGSMANGAIIVPTHWNPRICDMTTQAEPKKRPAKDRKLSREQARKAIDHVITRRETVFLRLAKQ